MAFLNAYFSPEAYQRLKSYLFDRGYYLSSTLGGGQYFVTRIEDQEPCCRIMVGERGLEFLPESCNNCSQEVRELVGPADPEPA